MPSMIQIDGQLLVKISKEEILRFYRGFGKGDEFAEKMTRSVMGNNDTIAYGKVLPFSKMRKIMKESSAFKIVDFQQEKFLKNYAHKKES